MSETAQELLYKGKQLMYRLPRLPWSSSKCREAMFFSPPFSLKERLLAIVYSDGIGRLVGNALARQRREVRNSSEMAFVFTSLF